MSPSLRRIASSPQLQRMSYNHYAAGNWLKLRVNADEVTASSPGPRFVRAEVVRVFEPITMAAVMIVRVDDMDIKGTFVLKLYDAHRADDLRREWMSSFRPTTDLEFQKLVLREDGKALLHELLTCDLLDFGADQKDEEDVKDIWKDPQWETWVYAFSQKMYEIEAEVFRRMEHRGGVDIPQLVAFVDLPCSKSNDPHLRNVIDDVPGILMQYLPGFPLTDLYTHPTSRDVPRDQWRPLVLFMRATIKRMRKRGIGNRDIDHRNTVVCWDPISGRFRLVLIDFGHCFFRGEDMSEVDWWKKQWETDEGAMLAE
jgi:hypothetical protein